MARWPPHEPSVCVGVSDASVKARLSSLPNQRGVGGRPINIDITELSFGSILGKGSFAVVSLHACPDINRTAWVAAVEYKLTHLDIHV